MPPTRGTVLVLLGVGLFVTTMAASAATAPSRTVDGGTPAPGGTATPPAAGGTDAANSTPGPGTTTPAGPRTLVGVQGGWVSGGNVRMYSGTAEVWRETTADGYFEGSALEDGTVLAAYANETSTDCGDVGQPCAETGFRHIDPSAPGGPEVVAEYSFPVATLTNSEVHAVDQVGPDEYVFTDMDAERVVVVENGTVAWEWRASSLYEAPANPTGRDWLHINDVDVIDDERFLVSVRNANQLVVLERGAGVVEMINEDDGGSDGTCLRSGRLVDADGDGEVRCGDPSVIQEQHNPQWLGPGAVLVADSENDRVVELHRTANGSWEPVWVLREAGGAELDWPRDADRLPGGTTLVTDSLGFRVFEVDPDGEVVWSVGTGDDVPYEADRLPFGEFAGRYDGAGTPDDDTATSADNGTATPTATLNGTATPPPYTLPTADGDGGGLNETGSKVPGLTLAVAGMKGTVGWLPFWFGELHLALTIVAAVFLVVGGVDRWRNPERTVELPTRAW